MGRTPPTYTRTRYANVYRRGRVLVYRFKDEHGKRVQRTYGTGTPKDAATAQANAQEQANRVRAGLEDPRLVAIAEHARRPIASIIDEYKAFLDAKGDSAPHVKETKRLLKKWAKDCNIATLGDGDAYALTVWLGDMKTSARTRNQFRTAVVALYAWAFAYGRIAWNPCPAGNVPRANEDADRRRLSRALLPDELSALLGSAPAKRAAFYTVAVWTGLRWREMTRFRWGDVDLEVRELVAGAGWTKNGKTDVLPIAEPAATALVSVRPDRCDLASLVFPTAPTIVTWKKDLRTAGIIGTKKDAEAGYVDERGRRLDRKCLRMTYATTLRDAGVDLRDAQRLLRHSDPKLTANIYTDVRLPNLAADLGRAVTYMSQKTSTSRDNRQRDATTAAKVG